MRELWRLVTSPYAMARAGLTGLATILASQAGLWFDNSLFGQISVFYAVACGIAILAKGGGDAVFARTLASSACRAAVLSSCLSASLSRWGLVLVPAGIIAIWQFHYGIAELIALSAMSLVIVTGNALRISLSPDYQLGYDNASVTIVAVCLAITTGTPVWMSALVLAGGLALLQIRALLKAGACKLRLTAPAEMSSATYMMSELACFTFGSATPVLMALIADMEMVGAIRSVERLVCAGTFALFLVNNRLFHEFSHNRPGLRSLPDYLRRYCLPSTLFFLIVMAILAASAAPGFVPNIADQWAVFLLYALAYLLSVACGPVSGALNFLGQERFVLISSLSGAAIALASLAIAVMTRSPMALVMGTACGVMVSNLSQIIRLSVIFNTRRDSHRTNI